MISPVRLLVASVMVLSLVTPRAFGQPARALQPLEAPPAAPRALGPATQPPQDQRGKRLTVAEASLFADVDDVIALTTRARGPSAQILVVPSAAVEPKEFAAIVEDMQVMSRILDKALGQEKSTFAHFVLGGMFPADPDTSNVWSSNLAGAATPTQAIFLEGFGALFVTRVDYPLAPTSEEAEPAKESEESVWEKTRRELYGPQRDPTSWSLRSARRYGGPLKEYDPKQVDELQKTLLETLEHAANIRSLKPEDSVAITVLGLAGGVSPANVVVVRLLADGKVQQTNVPLSQAFACRPTALAIRVKKSDVDALAAGQLTFDQLREKATILNY